MEWSDELVTRLRNLWSEGLTTAEIGRRLGISKNAVVGKAHRLDLQARPSPIRRDGAQAGPRRVAPPRRVHGPTLPPLTPTGGPVGERARAERGALRGDGLIDDAVMDDQWAAPAISAPVRSEPTMPDVRREPVMASPIPPRRVMAPALVSRATPMPRQSVCCWPIGEPGTADFRFCDGPALTGKPYCAPHAEIAYVRVRDRRSDAA